MGTVTIYPTSSSVTNSLFLSEPAQTNANLYKNLDDTSEDDYIWTEGSFSQDVIHLGFQDPTIPAGNIVSSIVVHYNAGNQAGDMQSQIGVGINGVSVDERTPSNGYNTHYTKTLTTNPATGLAWNSTSLAAITSDIEMTAGQWDPGAIALCYVYIVVNYETEPIRRIVGFQDF